MHYSPSSFPIGSKLSSRRVIFWPFKLWVLNAYFVSCSFWSSWASFKEMLDTWSLKAVLIHWKVCLKYQSDTGNLELWTETMIFSSKPCPRFSICFAISSSPLRWLLAFTVSQDSKNTPTHCCKSDQGENDGLILPVQRSRCSENVNKFQFCSYLQNSNQTNLKFAIPWFSSVPFSKKSWQISKAYTCCGLQFKFQNQETVMLAEYILIYIYILNILFWIRKGALVSHFGVGNQIFYERFVLWCLHTNSHFYSSSSTAFKRTGSQSVMKSLRILGKYFVE